MQKSLNKGQGLSSDAEVAVGIDRIPAAPAPSWIASGDIERVVALVLASALGALPSVMRTRVIRQLSRIVGTVWYKTNRGIVRRVRHHLQVLFKKPSARLEALVRDQLVLASWNALIINLLPSLHDEHLGHLLQIEGLYYLDEFQKRNQAILLLGAHYGIYGYAVAAILSAKGYPVWLVGYSSSYSPPSQASYLYRKLYWPRVQRLNQRVKIATVDPNKTLQPGLVKILEQKTDLFYLIADQYFIVRPDQDCPANLVPLQFLTHTVYLDISGIRLAKKMGAQPLMILPAADGRCQRVLIEPIEWASDGLTTADIAQDLQVYLAYLEQRLLECPALWRDLRRSDLLPRMGIFESEGSTDG